MSKLRKYPTYRIKKVYVLPFHQPGEFKWKKLGLKYALEGLNPPSENIGRVIEQFNSAGVKTS
jgi:pyruvate-formate lyase-activating enzyme